MRIISGKHRGLKLAEFEVGGVRPTADRVKESLFNIIYGKVADARVLDLFCGSGNLGIECLSRGAEYVQFNDISAASLTVLKRNLAKITESNYGITNLDFTVCLARADKFDIIFCDPPYKSDAGIKSLEIIGKNALLKDDGVVILERDLPFLGSVAGLKVKDERKYGRTYLTFFGVDL